MTAQPLRILQDAGDFLLHYGPNKKRIYEVNSAAQNAAALLVIWVMMHI